LVRHQIVYIIQASILSLSSQRRQESYTIFLCFFPGRAGIGFVYIRLLAASLNKFCQYLRKIHFYEVGYQMAVGSMSICDPHHPQALDLSEVSVSYVRILINLFLAWNESFS